MAYWQALHVYMVIKVGEKKNGWWKHAAEWFIQPRPNEKQVCISTTWWRENKGWVGLCDKEAAAVGITNAPGSSLHKVFHLMTRGQ